ncbi:branched-chain amino acid ABC transporter permease [candidate division TA06 bacterium]|uniref:Branched-chain amino acid ABC transporter permease n=1 Tax=candidate division TA06 bacterium TaxID=2250710 RepID=A0A933IBX2_UNCT6|nr:branched-chain amino acid ABC transporter permease [candidate division TA06 bacterium]
MLFQQFLNGLTLGSIYALIALGYTMVYGILEFINFAHGEIYMIGAYLAIIALGLLNQWGLNTMTIAPLIVIVFAMIYAAAFGATIEKIAYKPLRNAPRLSPLISALGVSIFLQNFVMLTQGARDKVFNRDLLFSQRFTQGGISIFSCRLSYIQILIIVTAVVLMLGLTRFINRTRLGKAMRAVSQDQKMAKLCGIDVDFIIRLTFIIGSALAAAAGVLVALYYGLVNFYIGYVAGLKAFIAAVVGGIGSVPGAMLGGLLLGMAESFGAGYLSAQYKDVYAFVILIVVLLVRPQGILGRKNDRS